MDDNHTPLYSFIARNIHILLLGTVFALSSIGLFLILTFSTTQLNAYGPTALIYFNGIKDGLFISTTILFTAFIVALFFKAHIKSIFIKLKSWFNSLTKIKKNLFILGICIIFAFTVHGGNVINGYFNMDDFEVIMVNHTHSFGESLLIPHGNDHTMPLFMAEMRGLDVLFGQNPIPYNLFIFLLFAFIPFFVYLMFQRLKIGLPSFFVFLTLFSGATGWADMLSGFNIMSTYMQIILFFSIAMWSYLAWSQTNKNRYLIFFGLATLFAVTIDLPGVWVLPVLPLWMFFVYWIKQQSFKIKFKSILEFLKINKQPLFIFFGVALVFIIFVIITFTILQPDTFLSALNGEGISIENDRADNWKPYPLISNSLSLFASGVSLTVFAPNIVKLLSHPALINKAQGLWPLLEIFIVIGNVLLLWLSLKYAKMREKKFIFFLLSVVFITLAMVVIARPDNNLIPDFDYRYAGPTFYAYILFLSIGTFIFINTKKRLALKIIIPTVIILFSAQQAFSFQAVRLKEEAKLRKTAIIKFENSLLIELNTLSKNAPLIIPNLSGAHIFKLMSGYTLADYLLFFDSKAPIKLIRNTYMQPDVKTGIVETVPSIRASTSPAFKNALFTSQSIRKYYTSPILLRFTTLEQKDNLSYPAIINKNREIVIKDNTFDPERFHTLRFSLYTDNIGGNLELSIVFNNEFSDEREVQNIRIDDFTPYVLENNKRIYNIETDLLQIHTYSLSETISNLILYVPETKGAIVKNLYFK